MYAEFLETNALLLQHVVETMIGAEITRKKRMNKALTTQKPHRNHIEPIEQLTDQPILNLLHNVAHPGLEIPSTSPNHRKLICDLVRRELTVGHSESSETPFTFRVRTGFTQHFRLGFTTG